MANIAPPECFNSDQFDTTNGNNLLINYIKRKLPGNSFQAAQVLYLGEFG
jgi:hypothetical protein